MTDFSVDVEDDGTLVVLRLHGELDLATVPTVEDAIERHAGRQVVVDLAGLEFMDSSGVRLVVQLNRPEVAFMAAGPRVTRVLDMTGVTERLTWVAEPSEVLS